MKITTNRGTPLTGVATHVLVATSISAEEVDRIFWKRLADLSEGAYIDVQGNLQQYEDTHPHNGENIYHSVGVAETLKDDERWKIAIAAIRLRKAIMETAV